MILAPPKKTDNFLKPSHQNYMDSLTSTIDLLLFFSSSMAKGANKEQFSHSNPGQ